MDKTTTHSTISRWLLPLRMIGSMYFAIALILILAAVMAWATFLGMQFGDDTSNWAVYHAGWFLFLCGMLGLSVLFSALLRFPWKKYQLGFLVTHLGILVLLVGCWFDFEYGRSAYLSVAEGETNSVASCPKESHFELRITRNGKTLQKTIPFQPGPFSWRFYGQKPFVGWGAADVLPRFPWSFLPRNHADETLFHDADCELVILDFLQAGRVVNGSGTKGVGGASEFEPAGASDFRWEAANAGGNVTGTEAAKGAKMQMASWKPWVKVRLTVDEEPLEFWLQEFEFFQPGGFERNTADAANRTVFRAKTQKGTDVSLICAQNTIALNFAVRLNRFNNRLDPGTSMASHYSSNASLEEDGKIVAENLNVLMNQPIDIFEPGTKQVWRLFQTSYNGPYMNPKAVENTEGKEPRDVFYVSTFTVYYSPGRGLLYLGCLLIVLGIGIMYSMKAYFFSSPGKIVPVRRKPVRERD